jgi:uncharacterized membrane protein
VPIDIQPATVGLCKAAYGYTRTIPRGPQSARNKTIPENVICYRNITGVILPYCTQCGTEVSAQAAFCHVCGSPQPKRPVPPPVYVDPLDRLSDRTASMLCYIPVFGVIPAIVFLATQKYRRNAKVRFNAFQSLYLFLAFVVVSSVLPPFFWFSFGQFGFHAVFIPLLKGAVFVLWVYLLIKAAQEERVHLPIIGDLAARSAAEQM